jgi:hypothetical protein
LATQQVGNLRYFTVRGEFNPMEMDVIKHEALAHYIAYVIIKMINKLTTDCLVV